MNRYSINAPMRLFFTVSGSVIWLGIGLTGFATAHWVLYVPAVFFLFAAATGICPGMIVANALFRNRASQ